ncbi:MAG: beta-galactosidase trimerization domain-containing protein, partial [Aeromonadaceae bacterium]
VIAPMLYMVREGFAERVDAFVQAGGHFVASYWSGIVNESDLCHLGGFPGPLRPILGIWAEEIDGLYDHERNAIAGIEGNELGLSGPYEVTHLCERIQLEGARALARYQSDFYAGEPAVTLHEHGRGRAYYVASRNDLAFQRDFFGRLASDLRLPRALATELPYGVTAQSRRDGEQEFVFVQNYTGLAKVVSLPAGYEEMTTSEPLGRELSLSGYGCRVLRRALD